MGIIIGILNLLRAVFGFLAELFKKRRKLLCAVIVFAVFSFISERWSAWPEVDTGPTFSGTLRFLFFGVADQIDIINYTQSWVLDDPDFRLYRIENGGVWLILMALGISAWLGMLLDFVIGKLEEKFGEDEFYYDVIEKVGVEYCVANIVGFLGCTLTYYILPCVEWIMRDRNAVLSFVLLFIMMTLMFLPGMTEYLHVLLVVLVVHLCEFLPLSVVFATVAAVAVEVGMILTPVPAKLNKAVLMMFRKPYFLAVPLLLTIIETVHPFLRTFFL